MSVTTFTFIVMWEHSHYILFVQGLALLLLDCFDLVPARKAHTHTSLMLYSTIPMFFIYYSYDFNNGYFLFFFFPQTADVHKVYLSSLLVAYILQYQKPSLLSCPLLSLLVANMLAKYLQVQ